MPKSQDPWVFFLSKYSQLAQLAEQIPYVWYPILPKSKSEIKNQSPYPYESSRLKESFTLTPTNAIKSLRAPQKVDNNY